MRRWMLLAVAALAVPPGSSAWAAEADWSGQLRAVASDVVRTRAGPLARADALSPGIVVLPASGLALEGEWRGQAGVLSAVGTLRAERLEGGRWHGAGWVNELVAAGGGESWQFSAGKKIVGWDVGYGFRPNDVVQQESRRRLLSTTVEGRPLLMVEHFDASTAWSLVWVNPHRPRAERGAGEPALALRVYRRDGALDWHGFARYGAHTHASLGAAAAWVADEALALHASLRWMAAADTLRPQPGVQGLLPRSPWLPARSGATAQVLLGGTWTHADRLSLLVEAWWDGTAMSAAQWRQWGERNRSLTAMASGPAPAQAVAGNLAWQAEPLGANANIHRANLFARVSWAWDQWQPAVDLLVTPADGGLLFTASLSWQGDRVRLDAGWRQTGGPADAVLKQIPARRTAYFAATWAF